MDRPPKKVAGVRGPIPEADLKQLARASFIKNYPVTREESSLQALLDSIDRAPAYLREPIELARFAKSVVGNPLLREQGRRALTKAKKLLLQLEIPDDERARMEQIWHAILPGRVRMFQRTEKLLAKQSAVTACEYLRPIALQIRQIKQQYRRFHSYGSGTRRAE